MQQLGAKKADEKSIKVRQMKRTRTPIIEQRRGTIVVVAFLWRRVRIVVVVVKGARRYKWRDLGKVLNFFNGFFPQYCTSFIFSFEPISDAFIYIEV